MTTTSMILLFGNIGFQEILIIALIILLLFGGKKIPELMKGLGKGVKSFKDGIKEVEKDIRSDDASAADNASTPDKPKED